MGRQILPGTHPADATDTSSIHLSCEQNNHHAVLSARCNEKSMVGLMAPVESAQSSVPTT
jgi:hypothetical protein